MITPATRIGVESFLGGMLAGGLAIRIFFGKSIAIARKAIGNRQAQAQASSQGYAEAYNKAVGSGVQASKQGYGDGAQAVNSVKMK